ncbi:hypothetical protein LOTGIDRAFT_96468, partial [Lottia gigantea]
TNKQFQKSVENIEYCQSKIKDLDIKEMEEMKNTAQKYSDYKKIHFDERNKIIRNELPHFWKTAFVNHPQIEELLTEEDVESIDYLVDLYVEDFEDIRAGYFLHFEFSTNPYFTNTVITKEYHLMDKNHKVLGKKEPISVSSEIKWKPDMDLLAKKKKDKKKRKTFSAFFSWFTDNEDPASDELAEVIKEDLWLNPLQYFLDIEAD